MIQVRPVTYMDFQQAMDAVRRAPSSRVPPRTRRAVVDGYERCEPSGLEWCRQAVLSPDEGALARMIASESRHKKGGKWVDLPPQYLLAVAECAVHEARAKRITVFARVTMQGVRLKSGRPPKSAGYFGRQSGRWCASTQDPTEKHLAAARAVLAATEPLVTRDGRRWVHGRAMDAGRQAGKKLQHDAVEIVRKRGAEGWEWVGRIGGSDGELLIDPYVLMIFRFAGRGRANVNAGIAAMVDGRRRWRRSA